MEQPVGVAVLEVADLGQVADVASTVDAFRHGDQVVEADVRFEEVQVVVADLASDLVVDVALADLGALVVVDLCEGSRVADL